MKNTILFFKKRGRQNLILIFFILCWTASNCWAQFECNIDENENNSSEYRSGDCSTVKFENADEYVIAAPVMEVPVVFHFVSDNSGNNFLPGPLASDPWETDKNFGSYNAFVLMFNINSYLSALIRDNLSPNPEGNAGLKDSNIRFKFRYYDYSDQNFRFYSNTEPIVNVPDALNIKVSGSYSGNGWGGTANLSLGNEITLNNFAKLQLDIFPNISQHYKFATVAIHEFGHLMTLNHTFHCSNRCSGVAFNFPPNTKQECCGICKNGDGAAPECFSNCSPMVMGYGSQYILSVCELEAIWTNHFRRTNPFTVICNSTANQSPLVLNGNQPIIWEDLKILNSDLILESGVNLTVRCKVMMGEGRRVIVKKGANLNVDGGVFTQLCSNIWDGIVIEGNGSAQSGAGKVTLTNNAVIEYAKNGISMNPSNIQWPALASSWGGLVEGDNSTIRNCDRAVEFMQMDDDDSYFTGCTFTNLKQGITLWDNNNVIINGCTFSNIQNSAILAYDSRIVASNNTITGTKDGIELVSVTGTPYGSRISNNTINTTQDGVYAMAQTSASEFQMELNNIYSYASGITLEGMSIYTLSFNNFVGSTYASKFWATSSGYGYDYVHNNTFSSAFWGNLANYENTPEFNDNCYGFNGKDLEVNSGSIYETQGDNETVAGNCFSKGNTPAITVVNSVTFNYSIVPMQEPTCHTPQDYLNPIGYNIVYGSSQNQITCTPPTNIIYRKCFIPKTKAEGYLMIANILAQISILETNTSMNPELKKYLINRYRACIKKIRQDIIIIILEDDGSIGKTQARKDAAAYAKSTGDLSLHTIGFGILLEGMLYTDAQQYLASFPDNGGADARDFLNTQLINMDYIQNRGIYQLSETTRTELMQLGNKTTPVSGFARSLYYKLTGEKLPITFIHSEQKLEPRSIPKKHSKSNIVTYPNPVQGNVYHIDISEPNNNAIYQVKMYNLQGVLLQKSEIKGNGLHDLDISTINAGMYLLSVESSGINVYKTKFVKI
jgi:hypothetical protein